jgi:hypothetical protein
MNSMEGSKKRVAEPAASSPTKMKRGKRAESIKHSAKSESPKNDAIASPPEQLSSLSVANSETYSEAYYEAALVSLRSQRIGNVGYTFQGNDASIMYQHLQLATPA